MRIRNTQSGFSVVEIALVVAFVGLVAFIGYTAFSRMQDKGANAETNQRSSGSQDVPVAPQIESTSGLDAADATLDQMNTTEGQDGAKLDSELEKF